MPFEMLRTVSVMLAARVLAAASRPQFSLTSFTALLFCSSAVCSPLSLPAVTQTIKTTASDVANIIQGEKEKTQQQQEKGVVVDPKLHETQKDAKIGSGDIGTKVRRQWTTQLRRDCSSSSSSREDERELVTRSFVARSCERGCDDGSNWRRQCWCGCATL